jgi:hypothetical protein
MSLANLYVLARSIPSYIPRNLGTCCDLYTTLDKFKDYLGITAGGLVTGAEGRFTEGIILNILTTSLIFLGVSTSLPCTGTARFLCLLISANSF